jgi:hypothetical protein
MRTTTRLVKETTLWMLLHRAHDNAAGLDASGTLPSYCSGRGAEMDDITDVERTYLTVVEPDHQPTVGVYVNRLTEHIYRAGQLDANPSAERLQTRPIRRRDVIRERIERKQDPLEEQCRSDGGVKLVNPSRARRRPTNVDAESDDDPWRARRSLREDSGELRSVHEDVIGPFQTKHRISGLEFGYRPDDGQADAVHEVDRSRLRHVEVHRGQQVRSRRRIPSPVEAATTCCLVVGAQNGAVPNLASFSRPQEIRVGTPGFSDLAKVPNDWCGGHALYIGTRAEEDPDRQ